MKTITVALAVCLTGAWALARAQEPSIGELARRLRLEDRPRASRVYTELDLPLIRNAPISIIGPAEAPLDVSETESSNKQWSDFEKMWRQRFAQTRQDIARTEQEIVRIQRTFDAEVQKAMALTDLAYLNCPANGVLHALGYPGADRLIQLCGQLNERRAHLEIAKARLVTLEDDLRRAGGYPGWARE